MSHSDDVINKCLSATLPGNRETGWYTLYLLTKTNHNKVIILYIAVLLQFNRSLFFHSIIEYFKKRKLLSAIPTFFLFCYQKISRQKVGIIVFLFQI